MSNSKLQHWLVLFILEGRKQDGSVFPPASLHHITAGLIRHLKWNGRSQVNLFHDCDFHDLRASLNAEIKKLEWEGVEAKKRQAEVLTEANEDLMWSKGLLGDATTQSLVDTVIFYNGLYFALRCGKEHQQLRSSRCQRGNRMPRREALSLLHRRHLQESPRRPKMKKKT